MAAAEINSELGRGIQTHHGDVGEHGREEMTFSLPLSLAILHTLSGTILERLHQCPQALDVTDGFLACRCVGRDHGGVTEIGVGLGRGREGHGEVVWRIDCGLGKRDDGDLGVDNSWQ